MMTQKTKKLIQILIFCWLLLYSAGQSQAQTSIAQLTITEVDSSQFPDMTVQFQALDDEGIAIQEVLSSGISVLEDGNEVELSNLTPIDEGIVVHFVVDMGVGMNSTRWAYVRNAILEFVHSHMNGNSDLAAVTAVQADNLISINDFTNEKATLEAEILDSDKWPARETTLSNPLSVLPNLLDNTSNANGGAGKPKFIFLFTDALDRLSTDAVNTITEKAITLQIPIYTALVNTSETDAEGNSRAEPLRELANKSGGVYTLSGSNNFTALTTSYNQLAGYRRQYQLTYRASGTLSGPREIQITASQDSLVRDDETYTITITTPEAEILEPGANQLIVRRADTFTTDLNSIEPTSQTVIVEVVFPDGINRTIALAELLVNQEVVGMVRNLPAGTNIEIPWDLRLNKTTGTTEYSLQVDVTDELGFTFSTPPVVVSVQLSVPPAPTEESSQIPIIVTQVISQLSPTSTPVPCTFEATCGLETTVRNEPVASLSVFLVVGLAGFVFLNRRRIPTAVDTVRSTAVRLVNTTRKFFGPTPAKAYLYVLAGDEVWAGRQILVHGDTSLGRSRIEGSTYVFHENNPNSPISRLHCTIIDDENGFRIRDENSRFGTYLNHAQLQPGKEDELKPGDEIELAKLEHGGVLLRFQLATTKSIDSERETAPTRTISRNNGESSQNLSDRF